MLIIIVLTTIGVLLLKTGNIFERIIIPKSVSAEEIVSLTIKKMFKTGTIYHERSVYTFDNDLPITYEHWFDYDSPRFKTLVQYPNRGNVNQGFDLDYRWDIHQDTAEYIKERYVYEDKNARGKKLGEQVDLADGLNKLLESGSLKIEKKNVDGKDLLAVSADDFSSTASGEIYYFDQKSFNLVKREVRGLVTDGTDIGKRYKTVIDYQILETIDSTLVTIKTIFSPPDSPVGYKLIEREFFVAKETSYPGNLNGTTADWPTYNSIDNSLMFKYPEDWHAGKTEVFGSRTITEFKYNNNTSLFELTLYGNHNQLTGKPYNNLGEFLGSRITKSKDIFIDGHTAKKIEDQGKPGHVIPYEEVIVFTPDNKTIVSLNYKSSYYDKPTANGVLYQILSTFKFTNSKNTETTTNANVISYNIPSNWQVFAGTLGKSKLTFSYPLEVSAQYDDYSNRQSVRLMKGNGVLLDISLPEYFGFREYQNGSRREWFLENAKSNPTVQNITFYPINYANGNSFYQVKADKLNNLFGIIPVEPTINIYFGIIANRILIIRDWKSLPQEDIFRVLQSIQ